METKDTFFIEIEEWKIRSERGDVCGIVGCEDEPIVYCPRCGNWYCGEHSHMHFHLKLPNQT